MAERNDAAGGEARQKILAFCPNPTIDIWSEAEAVRPVHKIRTSNEIYDPGGGGINVARVVTELGGDSEVLALAGGVTGILLGELLTERGIVHRIIPIAGRTRVSFTVHERASDLEYRFVAPGPDVTEAELIPCLEAIRASGAPYVVASGSLPPGAPRDLFIRIGDIVAARGGHFVLDSSGDGLQETLRNGYVHLLKPSIGELSTLAGRRLDETSARDVAVGLVRSGRAGMVAVSMGASGALLVTRDRIIRSHAPAVHARSTVGAGDSFLGAMVTALAAGQPVEEAFALGCAAGAAAVLEPGTRLCRRKDVERFRASLPPMTILA
jgi:6-phosphofructokinase 2